MYEFYDTLFLVIYNGNGASVYSEGLKIEELFVCFIDEASEA